MARCCSDYSRTDLLRRAAAEAGRGLPAIEAGMPLPAGTGLDRRQFLARTTGLALAVYGGASLLPRAFEEGIAAALAGGARTSDIALGGGPILTTREMGEEVVRRVMEGRQVETVERTAGPTWSMGG